MAPRRRVGLCILVLGLLSACASQIPQKKLEDQRAASQVFEDELDLLQSTNPDEMAIKVILRKLKEAYQRCDKTLLGSVFSQDFTQEVFIPASPKMIIDRAKYFTGLAMTRVNKTECSRLNRQLSMAKIRIVRPETPSDRIEVALYTKYGSKYFNPRFSETFIFRRTGGKMVVGKRVMTPLHPKSLEYYQAEIYIGDLYKYEKYKTALQHMAWEDGDIFINRILGGTAYQTLSVDYSPKSVIVVFREPPPPGAKVKIAQWYYNHLGQLRITSEENHTVERVNPWFFLVTQTTTFMTGEVNYEVFVDGIKVLDRTYATR